MPEPVAGFELRRRLAAGPGTTEVWEARAPDGSPVALKRYVPNEAVPEGALRFRSERDLLIRLGGAHHLIRCLGALDDPPALVLEWASAGNLRDRLYPMGRGSVALAFSGDEVTDIGREIGDALAWLHANGVIHRDVKPSNILVMGDGTVRLADLSVAASGHPPRGLPEGWIEEEVGTLGYAAPELLRDPAAATPASDVYSLGATLYELLTGRLPFDLGPHQSEDEYRARIASGAPAVPLALRRWNGASRLGAAVMAALEPDPARRTATIAAFLAAL